MPDVFNCRISASVGMTKKLKRSETKIASWLEKSCYFDLGKQTSCLRKYISSLPRVHVQKGDIMKIVAPLTGCALHTQ